MWTTTKNTDLQNDISLRLVAFEQAAIQWYARFIFFFFALFFTCCCWLCNVHVHHVCFVQQFTSSSITSHWNYAYSSSSKIFEHKNFLITSYNSRGSSHIYYIHNVYILHLLFRTLTIVVNSIISHNLFGSCFRLLLVLLLYCMWFCATKKEKK